MWAIITNFNVGCSSQCRRGYHHQLYKIILHYKPVCPHFNSAHHVKMSYNFKICTFFVSVIYNFYEQCLLTVVGYPRNNTPQQHIQLTINFFLVFPFATSWENWLLTQQQLRKKTADWRIRFVIQEAMHDFLSRWCSEPFVFVPYAIDEPSYYSIQSTMAIIDFHKDLSLSIFNTHLHSTFP
jgi:hypothetical protein